ncbi:MAG: HEAT repeat domain-containing protein [Planctomycetota bacterium]
MSLLLCLLLLAADPPAQKVPQLVERLEAGDQPGALALLKEIGGLKGDHAEAKALVKLIRSRRPRKSPEVLEACFMALRGIGSRKVTRDLLRLLDHRPLKGDPRVRIGVCRAIEGSADPAAVKELVKLMRDNEDPVVAAAARAAGAYRYAREPVRKELFKTILDIYEATWNLKNSVKPELKIQKARAEKKWAVVAKPMRKSLELLSNTTQRYPPAWRHWWNKNKKRKWGPAPE